MGGTQSDKNTCFYRKHLHSCVRCLALLCAEAMGLVFLYLCTGDRACAGHPRYQCVFLAKSGTARRCQSAFHTLLAKPFLSSRHAVRINYTVGSPVHFSDYLSPGFRYPPAAVWYAICVYIDFYLLFCFFVACTFKETSDLRISRLRPLKQRPVKIPEIHKTQSCLTSAPFLNKLKFIPKTDV